MSFGNLDMTSFFFYVVTPPVLWRLIVLPDHWAPYSFCDFLVPESLHIGTRGFPAGAPIANPTHAPSIAEPRSGHWDDLPTNPDLVIVGPVATESMGPLAWCPTCTPFVSGALPDDDFCVF